MSFLGLKLDLLLFFTFCYKIKSYVHSKTNFNLEKGTIQVFCLEVVHVLTLPFSATAAKWRQYEVPVY